MIQWSRHCCRPRQEGRQSQWEGCSLCRSPFRRLLTGGSNKFGTYDPPIVFLPLVGNLRGNDQINIVLAICLQTQYAIVRKLKLETSGGVGRGRNRGGGVGSGLSSGGGLGRELTKAPRATRLHSQH